MARLRSEKRRDEILFSRVRVRLDEPVLDDVAAATDQTLGACGVVVPTGSEVAITIGLPVVRTSVDHGTAFDIAGTGAADERSMVEALKQAVNLAAVAG